MNIPVDSFDFHRPHAKDKALLQSLNTTFTPYADTAYGTLLTWWNLYDDLMITHINGNALIRSSYPTDGQTPAYMLVGSHEPDRTINEIFAYLIERGEEPVLHFSPHYLVESLQSANDYIITPDPDISEYVLSSDDHANLAGKDFVRIRHKIQNLINTHGHVDIREIDLSDAAERHAILNALRHWKSPADNDRDGQEITIIERSLDLHDDIGMRCLGAFLDDELIGFTLYKILPGGYANVNHVKVDYRYSGVFLYKIHSLAKHLLSEGVRFLNIEQDLGIEGLRIFKQRLRPIALLEKFTIRPR